MAVLPLVPLSQSTLWMRGLKVTHSDLPSLQSCEISLLNDTPLLRSCNERASNALCSGNRPRLFRDRVWKGIATMPTEKEIANARKNRLELLAAGLGRRELFKMGLLTSAGYLVRKNGLSAW